MTRILKYVFFLLLSGSGSATESRYIFKKINDVDGLTYNTVFDITQEESGIIWFATKQGLFRANGEPYEYLSGLKEAHL